MKYFASKVQITRSGKIKKELYIVKSEDLDAASMTTVVSLVGFDPAVIVTDIVSKNYVAVFMLEDGEGPIYEVNIEFDEIDGKVVKESYLQQANSTKEAETLLLENTGNTNVEIINTKKTNIVDFLIQED